jgi:hypothetical protein
VPDVNPGPTAPATLREWFPDVDVPEGLTLDDLWRAAALVREWQHDDDWSGLAVTAAVYRVLRSAEKESR